MSFLPWLHTKGLYQKGMAKNIEKPSAVGHPEFLELILAGLRYLRVSDKINVVE